MSRSRPRSATDRVSQRKNGESFPLSYSRRGCGGPGGFRHEENKMRSIAAYPPASRLANKSLQKVYYSRLFIYSSVPHSDQASGIRKNAGPPQPPRILANAATP